MPTYYRTSWVPERFYTAPVYAPARPLYIETPPAGESALSSLATGALIGGAAAIVLLLLTSGTKRRRVEV